MPVGSAQVERSFTAVRAVLPEANAAAFDEQLADITRTEIPDLARLDEFLSAWHRVACRITADPDDWQLMEQQADAINVGTQPLGPTMEEMAARRGIAL